MRAGKGNLADLSDVALLKQLRDSTAWLQGLCAQLFPKRGFAVSAARDFGVRAFDPGTVKEPGRTGSPWHLHYSVGR